MHKDTKNEAQLSFEWEAFTLFMLFFLFFAPNIQDLMLEGHYQ